jgi:hypothetical protein
MNTKESNTIFPLRVVHKETVRYQIWSNVYTNSVNVILRKISPNIEKQVRYIVEMNVEDIVWHNVAVHIKNQLFENY